MVDSGRTHNIQCQFASYDIGLEIQLAKNIIFIQLFHNINNVRIIVWCVCVCVYTLRHDRHAFA